MYVGGILVVGGGCGVDYWFFVDGYGFVLCCFV